MADADISSFVDITGTSASVARGFLEMTNGDVQQAIQLFFENPDLQHSINSSTAPPPRTSAATTGTTARRRGVREDEHGVIHIDSDDDDVDIDIDDDSDDVQMVASRAQEEEDAAMAKRLQEEMYSGDPAGAEGVRSPIRSTTETLVAPSAGWGASYGDDDDGQAEVMAQIRRRQDRRNRNANPFNQSIWDDPSQQPGAAPSSTGPTTRTQRLADLFRPPHELISRLTWDEARDEGKDEKKWLLVNIQDLSDFNCQALNRDIWKDAAVREIVSENFVFLQYSKEDVLARDYLNFYFRNHDDPESYPHVAIVDPRTGEQVKVWSGTPFPSALDFHSQLAEFLDRYSLNANSKNPVVKSKPRQAPKVDVDRMTEDEMLEMALKNSLANGGTSAGQSSNVVDPDSLTKSPRPEESQAAGSEQPEAEEASIFASISSTDPHVEPEHEPSATTRIQFRHASGRIIRRFNAQDPVRRMYEWLKAEPMDGKEGVEFELKRMPQGQDLIESLDQTIEEAGLKQGTVMIEFLD
ncbi:related to UBX5 - UBX (ubiquitin regulatory X) domain-containing protein [Cephalotrichum gorgonifer]|uniref:Related to UBX5 - UBX (Ubiquitin regulatory X) domain-containing protein n=1 Tax=Cephalotrichum gorgonifer TaxID=2041049 RepID=A0AAE8MQS3_9PEZI|nr:related to UBX5 - UBX (ubiquitin regulatory X) domain-containing protein [Cephalotrichum gorgonifer]